MADNEGMETENIKWGFANRLSARNNNGVPVVVKDRKGNPMIFDTIEEATKAMEDHARKYRVSTSEYVVGAVKLDG